MRRDQHDRWEIQMSVLDKAKAAAQEAAAKAKEAAEKASEKAKDYAAEHTEQMKGAIDKAGGVADKATKGKFSSKIEKVGEKAGNAVDKLKKDE
jgi:hemerythrin-like domain-containing protein